MFIEYRERLKCYARHEQTKALSDMAEEVHASPEARRGRSREPGRMNSFPRESIQRGVVFRGPDTKVHLPALLAFSDRRTLLGSMSDTSILVGVLVDDEPEHDIPEGPLSVAYIAALPRVFTSENLADVLEGMHTSFSGPSATMGIVYNKLPRVIREAYTMYCKMSRAYKCSHGEEYIQRIRGNGTHSIDWTSIQKNVRNTVRSDVSFGCPRWVHSSLIMHRGGDCIDAHARLAFPIFPSVLNGNARSTRFMTTRSRVLDVSYSSIEKGGKMSHVSVPMKITTTLRFRKEITVQSQKVGRRKLELRIVFMGKGAFEYVSPGLVHGRVVRKGEDVWVLGQDRDSEVKHELDHDVPEYDTSDDEDATKSVRKQYRDGVHKVDRILDDMKASFRGVKKSQQKKQETSTENMSHGSGSSRGTASIHGMDAMRRIQNTPTYPPPSTAQKKSQRSSAARSGNGPVYLRHNSEQRRRNMYRGIEDAAEASCSEHSSEPTRKSGWASLSASGTADSDPVSLSRIHELRSPTEVSRDRSKASRNKSEQMRKVSRAVDHRRKLCADDVPPGFDGPAVPKPLLGGNKTAKFMLESLCKLGWDPDYINRELEFEHADSELIQSLSFDGPVLVMMYNASTPQYMIHLPPFVLQVLTSLREVKYPEWLCDWLYASVYRTSKYPSIVEGPGELLPLRHISERIGIRSNDISDKSPHPPHSLSHVVASHTAM